MQRPEFQGVLATNENMPFILMNLEANPEIAVDTETSGLNVANGVDYLMGVCIDVPNLSAYIPFRHEYGNIDRTWLDPLVKILQEKDLIWHHRKFDYHSFATIGVDPLTFKGLSYDTMLLATLLYEEDYSRSLDFLSKKYLKDEGKFDGEIIKKTGLTYGFDKIPPEMYRQYGSYDTFLTRRLKEYLWPRILKENLESVYWDTEEPFGKLLYKIEQRGVGVNKKFAEDKARLGRARMATVARELGGNPASPKFLSSLLLEELELPVLAHTGSCEPCKRGAPVGSHKGTPSFNKIAMEEYDSILENMSNKTAKLITEYRGWQKAVTSLYEPLLEKVGPDGKIRTEFNQHRTVTGRLSASNPNLQQIPRGSTKPWNGTAKNCFSAGVEGFVLIGWDYSQVELRIASAYGNVRLLLDEFEKPDADPFNVLAPLIFGTLTPETRHDTKAFVYANLFGAGLNRITLQLGRPVEHVRPLFKNYQSSIRGIIDISHAVTKLVEETGVVAYWDGRKRHMRDRRKAYKAWNSVIQGGAAQMVKKAMLRCEKFEDENCMMVLTVHDEITFVIREDMVDKYEPLITEAMCDFPQFGVKFAVDGKEWGK